MQLYVVTMYSDLEDIDRVIHHEILVAGMGIAEALKVAERPHLEYANAMLPEMTEIEQASIKFNGIEYNYSIHRDQDKYWLIQE